MPLLGQPASAGSALRAAILSGGSAQAVELALREGGTSACDVADPLTGELPLHAAARLGQAGTIRRLLRCAAQVDGRTLNGTAATPLHLAAAGGHREAVETLLEAGANPVLTDVRGRTAARYAEDAGHLDIEQRLDALRMEAGDYGPADIARAASRSLTGAADAASKGLAEAAEGVRAALTSLPNIFACNDKPAAPSPAARTPARPQEAPPHAYAPSAASAPPAAPWPTPAPGAATWAAQPAEGSPSSAAAAAPAPAPAAPPAPAPYEAALQRIGEQVEVVEREAPVGHPRLAKAWQDDLTKAACQLDALEVNGDSDARAMRRALLARIDRASGLIDRRLESMAQTLADRGAVVAEIEERVGRLRCSSGAVFEALVRQGAEWRHRLSQAAADLDAVECATDAQRAERKTLLIRAEALEAEILRLERSGPLTEAEWALVPMGAQAAAAAHAQ